MRVISLIHRDSSEGREFINPGLTLNNCEDLLVGQPEANTMFGLWNLRIQIGKAVESRTPLGHDRTSKILYAWLVEQEHISQICPLDSLVVLDHCTQQRSIGVHNLSCRLWGQRLIKGAATIVPTGPCINGISWNISADVYRYSMIFHLYICNVRSMEYMLMEYHGISMSLSILLTP